MKCLTAGLGIWSPTLPGSTFGTGIRPMIDIMLVSVCTCLQVKRRLDHIPGEEDYSKTVWRAGTPPQSHW